MSNFLERVLEDFKSSSAKDAGKKLLSLADADNYVGDLLSLNYDNAVVLVHDFHRQEVGGLPMGCFLLATRIDTQSPTPANEEDTALLLLRVVGGSQLPNHAETSTHRMEAGFRASDTPENWDSNKKTDQFTLHKLRYAGVQCDVLGTFRMKEINSYWNLSFGADISNFYSGQGMKVYKPMGESLRRIVNYTKPTGTPHPLAGDVVEIGRIRYCASEISDSSLGNVIVGMEPTDLLARRTALFGMSRSGKSNTIKIIASSIFNLRKKGAKIGQLIFDVNGEYCNDNLQDDEGCLRNIWRTDPANFVDSYVSTYGLFRPQNDPKRNLLKLNFFGNEPSSWYTRSDVESAMDSLVIGKEHVNDALSAEGSGYIAEFRNTSLSVPDGEWGGGDSTRYRRAIQIYRSFLVKARFDPPAKTAYISGLFQPGLITKMKEWLIEQHKHKHKPGSDAALALEATLKAEVDALLGDNLEWDPLYKAAGHLARFIDTDEFGSFDSKYQKDQKAKKKPVKSWADGTLRGVLSLLDNTRGLRVIGNIKYLHVPDVNSDYAADIVKDVRQGKLVIVDQSTGAPEEIKHTTDRVMWKLFDAQKNTFINPKFDKNNDMVKPPDVVVYAEEAHNLLPANSGAAELQSVWARTAKEGSKFHIGMVYSTQEPSSILANILKNTDNWFVAHLNNQDEIMQLKKYYDFAAFERQILKVPETGFLRVRCLSNPYIVPVQVRKFVAPTGSE